MITLKRWATQRLSAALTPRNSSSVSPCICMPPKRWVGMQSGASWLKGQRGVVKATKPEKLSRTWPAVIGQMLEVIRAKGGSGILLPYTQKGSLPFVPTHCRSTRKSWRHQQKVIDIKDVQINQRISPTGPTRSLPTSVQLMSSIVSG